MDRNFQIRIKIWKHNPRLINKLEEIDLQGKDARLWLIDTLSPTLKKELEEITLKVKQMVKRAYNRPGGAPGDKMPTYFLGEYGNSILHKYVSKTTVNWPWAYVGSYPTAGPDTRYARNPMIYIPAIEGVDFTGSQGRTGGGKQFYNRISYWVERKMQLRPGTPEHHRFTWLLFTHIRESGVKAKQLFRQVEISYEYHSAQVRMVRNITKGLEEAIAGKGNSNA